MKKARDYQVEGKQTVLNKLHNEGQSDQLFVMATGLGKTFVACDIATEFKKTLWITHKEELIDQSALSLLGTKVGYKYHSAIESQGGYLPFLNNINNNGLFNTDISYQNALKIQKEIGVVKAQRMDKTSNTIVASVQTMVNRLQHFDPTHFDLIIADEAHYAMAKSWQKVLNHFNPTLKLGLTATPYRLDGAPLSSTFGKITYDRDIKYGIDNGWLVEIDAVRVKTGVSLDEVHKQAGELKTGELEKVINTPVRNNLIVDKYLEYSPGKQAMVFAVDVQHCMDLHETFEKRGIKSVFIVGDENLCPNRRERFAAFKSGKAQILVNVDIATTGFDHDMVETLITARPTTSLALFLQIIGRGTRTERGVIDGLETPEDRIEAIKNSRKPKLLVLDITDNTTKHNLINTWTLEDGKRIEDRVFTTKKKKQELIFKRDEDKRKLKHTQIKDQKVDLLKLPKINIRNTGRMTEDATELQLKRLAREGYNIVDSYYTKFDASMIISNLDATDWQMKQLKIWGYDTSKGCTYAQYTEVKRIKEGTAFEPKKETKVYVNNPFIGLE